MPHTAIPQLTVTPVLEETASVDSAPLGEISRHYMVRSPVIINFEFKCGYQIKRVVSHEVIYKLENPAAPRQMMARELVTYFTAESKPETQLPDVETQE